MKVEKMPEWIVGFSWRRYEDEGEKMSELRVHSRNIADAIEVARMTLVGIAVNEGWQGLKIESVETTDWRDMRMMREKVGAALSGR